MILRIGSLSACAILALHPVAAQSLNPTGSIGVHDPVLIKDGSVYYVFHTGGRIPVKTSPNLINWSNAGSAFSRTGKPLAEVAPTNLAKRGGGIEGAFIVYARVYHLFTSWDKCCAGTSSTYNMPYGRSTAVTGPYVDKAGKDLTAGGGTLLSDGSGSPGGLNGILVDNGNYYIVYHVYDGRNNPASL
jgi:beta-xylosidase